MWGFVIGYGMGGVSRLRTIGGNGLGLTVVIAVKTEVAFGIDVLAGERRSSRRSLGRIERECRGGSMA